MEPFLFQSRRDIQLEIMIYLQRAAGVRRSEGMPNVHRLYYITRLCGCYEYKQFFLLVIENSLIFLIISFSLGSGKMSNPACPD